jgi:hypothetical protein
MVIVTSSDGISVGNPTTNVDMDITNNDTGVVYTSLKGDSQLSDMLFSAYGVSDLYNNNFQNFLSSGDLGYSITGGQVENGWNSSFNPDGTFGLTHGPGLAGFDYDQFSDGKTMDGNFFFNTSLLDADGDGNNNYELKLFSDLTQAEINDSLTIAGVVGANNGGNSITAFDGLGSGSATGNQYALVATDYHPSIPEPASAAGVIGGLALVAAVAYNRMRK